MDAITKRARELLAAEYDKAEMEGVASAVRLGGHDKDPEFLAIIAALTPPEDYVLVPFEPTSEMVKAGLNAPFCGHPETGGPSLTGMWTAMLAVRPEVKP